MRKLIHGLPSEHKQDVEELGCVLADMTDSYSSKEEHSQSQDSPVHSPQTTDDTSHFGLTEEQLSHMVSDSEFVGSNSELLESWNGVLQDYLMKDNTV